MLGVEATTPLRGVLPAIDDVMGIAIMGVAACVPEAILCRSQLDTSCTISAFVSPAGGVCTEASRSCCAALPALVEATERMRDAEL